MSAFDIISGVLFSDGSKGSSESAPPSDDYTEPHPPEWDLPPVDPDSEPDAGPDASIINEPDNWPHCEVCGNPIEWSGRGRRPKKCADHRTRTASPKNVADGSAPAAPRMRQSTMDRRKAAIVGNLQEGLGAVCAGMVNVAPVTAHTMALTGPPAVASLVEVCAPYPRVLDGLEKFAATVPFIDIARFGGGLVFALGVDMGRFTPYGLLPEYLGVAQAAENAGWKPEPEQPTAFPAPEAAGFPVRPPDFKLSTDK